MIWLGKRNTMTDLIQNMYKIAIENRAREIDLFWKRATFFWAFQLASIAILAAGLDGFELNSDRSPSAGIVFIAIGICVGLVSSLSGWLSARGSKYWQEVWEKKVEIIEMDNPLFRTKTYVEFSFSGAGPWSVSKQAIIFILYTFLIWLSLYMLAFFILVSSLMSSPNWFSYESVCFYFMVLAFLASLILLFFGKTNPKMIMHKKGMSIKEVISSRFKNLKSFFAYQSRNKSSSVGDQKDYESDSIKKILESRSEFNPKKQEGC